MKAPKPKELMKRILHFDYKGLFSDIKNFNYKSPQAYKALFQDKNLRKRIIWLVIVIVLQSLQFLC